MSYSQCYGVISRSAHFPPSPLQPRQDAARSPLLVQRQPPSPAGGQLGPDPGELPLQVTRRQEAVGPGTQSPGPRQATTRGTGPWRWPATRTARPTTSPTHSQGPAWTGSGRSTGGHAATHGGGKNSLHRHNFYLGKKPERRLLRLLAFPMCSPHSPAPTCPETWLAGTPPMRITSHK